MQQGQQGRRALAGEPVSHRLRKVGSGIGEGDGQDRRKSVWLLMRQACKRVA